VERLGFARPVDWSARKIKGWSASAGMPNVKLNFAELPNEEISLLNSIINCDTFSVAPSTINDYSKCFVILAENSFTGSLS